ncbi:MAG: 50S ribosomal protein L5 [Bacteroidetes bacterium]|nr:50S ribosomal protein L5 [Bacteroidota bacterium]MBU1116063.1 50S ribosomal protein L5 [Bacteroidota bacterium]MBU1799169.1 50S ribosomal protein L5 [Bacteroidota bacterium]
MAKKEKSEDVVKEIGNVKVPLFLLEKYKSEIVALMMEKFSYSNIMEVPKLEKIVVNMGVGEAVNDSKILDAAVKDLETITGQKAQIRLAKTSISNFKLREGMKIGAKVTLRDRKMYEFLNRLISIALPRVRDFRGIPDKSFDGRGNYTLGIKEQIIFPEIDVEKINKVVGMDVTFVTTAKTDNEAYELLLAFGVPFKKKQA